MYKQLHLFKNKMKKQTHIRTLKVELIYADSHYDAVNTEEPAL